MPKYFEKFSNPNAKRVLVDMITFAARSVPRIKVASLISFTYYKHVMELTTLDKSIQPQLFKIVYSLIEECEEDGLPVLLEAIGDTITINPSYASAVSISQGVNVIDLIFKIAFKDPGNVQLITDSSECLTALLENTSVQII